MSITALNWAFSAKVESSNAKFILVALSNFADEDGYCYPSQARLARDTGQSERSVRRHLAQLEADQWITRSERRRKNGSRTSDAFTLNWAERKRPIWPVVTATSGQSDQSNRPDWPEQPARLAAPEPPVEPPEEPSGARAREAPAEGPASTLGALAWLTERMTEAKAREWFDYWTARLGSDEVGRRLQRIRDEGPTGPGLNERMLTMDAGSVLGHTEAA